MSADELLVCLNPHSVSEEPTPAATGDKLTPQDVLAGLAACNEPIGTLLLMIRVAGHWHVYRSLFPLVTAMIRERAERESWRCYKPYRLNEIIDGMAQHAIFEHCIPIVCRSCKGRGYKYPRIGGQMIAKVCDRCSGTGGVKVNDASRAAGIGVGYDAYRKTYGAGYTKIRKELQYCEAEAIRKLSRVMRA